jgi:EAL domain-containing protein (putative c-di-GMP-specific phosphodiesterase class I)
VNQPETGTGYSSIAQLKRLPIHALKIDKSFVSDLLSNPDDEIIVRSTIELIPTTGASLAALRQIATRGGLANSRRPV